METSAGGQSGDIVSEAGSMSCGQQARMLCDVTVEDLAGNLQTKVEQLKKNTMETMSIGFRLLG